MGCFCQHLGPSGCSLPLPPLWFLSSTHPRKGNQLIHTKRQILASSTMWVRYLDFNRGISERVNLGNDGEGCHLGELLFQKTALSIHSRLVNISEFPEKMGNLYFLPINSTKTKFFLQHSNFFQFFPTMLHTRKAAKCKASTKPHPVVSSPS